MAGLARRPPRCVRCPLRPACSSASARRRSVADLGRRRPSQQALHAPSRTSDGDDGDRADLRDPSAPPPALLAPSTPLKGVLRSPSVTFVDTEGGEPVFSLSVRGAASQRQGSRVRVPCTCQTRMGFCASACPRLDCTCSKRLTVTHARPRSSVQQISWQSGLSEHSRDSRSQDYGKFPPFWWKRPTSCVVIVCCMVCCCISPRRKKANKVTVIPVVIATPASLREDETAEAGTK